MEKLLFVVNPSSGGKRAQTVADNLEEVFKAARTEIKRYETTGQDDFKRLTIEAMQEGIRRAYIFGGDGTISEYVQAISGLTERPEIVLIPLGTTNNLARALNTELNMNALISNIQENNMATKKVDVGQVNEAYFISTLSAGAIPEMVWKTDDELKENLGPFAYILEGISALNENETFDLMLETDEGKYQMDDVTLLVIGLSNSVFGISRFFQEATINDGKLHLYALKDSDLLKSTASLASDVFTNTVNNRANDLSYTTSFSKGRISVSKPMYLAMDGEKGPTFPIDLDILPEHLTFVVPVENES